MNIQAFYKIFPPPEFMLMDHAGLEISDDAIRYVTYKNPTGDRKVGDFMSINLPTGLLVGGDTIDIEALRAQLKSFKEKAGLSFVKVSIPEEKAYLFQAEVPSTDLDSIRQNIESKLEENIPLMAKDAIFHFDLLPSLMPGGNLRASVSVVPKTYIEKMLELLHSVGLKPVAFEVIPRSLAHVLVPAHNDKTIMVVHIMDHKIGVYVVSAGTVNFASTVSRDLVTSSTAPRSSVEDTIAKEVIRIYEYWISRPDSTTIQDVVLVGSSAQAYEKAVRDAVRSFSLNVITPNIWANICHIPTCPPSMSREDSLAYAVAAGLALS